MTLSQAIWLSRREFLVAAPATVAGVSIPGIAAAGPACGSGRHVSTRSDRVALSYWPDSGLTDGRWSLDEDRLTAVQAEERAEDPDEQPALSGKLISAESLIGGDPLFLLHGARVTLHGLAAAPGLDLSRLPSLAMEVDYKPSQSWRYQAWSFTHRDGLAQTGGPARFDVPAEPAAGLTLAFKVGDSEVEQVSRLSLAPVTGGPGLRRGIYVATWGDHLPGWRGLEMAAETPSSYRLVRGGIGGESVAALVLSIDYAGGAGDTV